MKSSSTLEIISGICVVAFMIAIVYIFSSNYHDTNIKDNKSYRLYAFFSNVDGIIVGSDIKISGIKIGEVNDVKLDMYRAKLTFNIAHKYQIPDDSEAAITTSGIMGDKYISIFPGISDQNFSDDDQINRTRSAINLENIINKFFNKGSKL